MIALIFGASGSAGGSVLRELLAAADVSEVRAIVRRPLSFAHPKLQTFVHADYLDFHARADALAGVDACYYCLGISVSQVSGEAEYRRITYDFALAAARGLLAGSPAAAFHFISGGSTSLDSRFMWARVKAETERDLMALDRAVCWRPAAIDGLPSASEPWLYKWLRPVYPILSPFRGLYVKGGDIGKAMLVATRRGYRDRIIENREIRDLADSSRL